MSLRSTSGRVRKTFMSAVALVLAFTAGSAFVASGQPEANTYYGCLSGTGGLTKVSINEAPTCPGAYTLISWNATGPQGLQGPQGPQGPQGEQGPAGPELINIQTGWINIFGPGSWGQDVTITNTGVGAWHFVFPAGTFPPAAGEFSQENFPSVQLTPALSGAPVQFIFGSWGSDGSFVLDVSCGNATDCAFSYAVIQNVPEADGFAATSEELDSISIGTQP